MAIHKGGILLATILVVLMTQSAVHASLILNGGFESPIITPQDTYQLGIPTSWSGSSSVSIFNGVVVEGGLTWPAPQAGDQFVDIGNHLEFITQAFTVLVGGDYILSWYDNTADVFGNTSSPYEVKLEDSSLQQVFSQSLNAYLAGPSWQHRSVTVSLSPGDYELTFTSTGIPRGLDTLLDSVSLTTESVPEPTSWILFGGLLSLVGGALRCRSKRASATGCRKKSSG